MSRIYIYGAMALALVGLLAWFGHSRYAAGQAEREAHYAIVHGKQKTAALEESFQNAKESQRRIDRQQENDRAQTQQFAQITAGRARDVAARNRLQHQSDAYRAALRARPTDPSAGGSCEAATAAVDLYSDLLRRASDVAGELGRGLEKSHAAGLRCERDYTALTLAK